MAGVLVYRHRVADVLADPVSVLLSSVTGSFGIRESDTGTILAADGTPMVKTATGTYKFDFSAVANYSETKRYEFYIEVLTIYGETLLKHGFIPAQIVALPSQPAALQDYRLSLATLRQKVLALVNDPYGQRYGTEVDAELNNALVELSIETTIIKESLVVLVEEGQYEYDIAELARSAGLRDFIAPLHIRYNGGESPALHPSGILRNDAERGGQVEGELRAWGVDLVDPGKVSLMDIPAASGSALPSEEGNITIIFTALPEHLEGDGNFPDPYISPVHHRVLPYGAARNLLLHEEDPRIIRKAYDFDNSFRSMLRNVMAESEGARGRLEIEP